jgi:putative ATPase
LKEKPLKDELFEFAASQSMKGDAPLAERMRPLTIDAFLGQSHVMGPGGLIRNAVVNDRIFSMILWGPAGCGKTSLARIVAAHTRSHFVQFSAVLSGVKEIRAVVQAAREQRMIHRKRTILFVDEIHRFNKAQQDAFLHYVESGLITLIGATTENPSFEVIAPLLSRCRVIVLHPIPKEDMAVLVERVMADREVGLGRYRLTLGKKAMDYLLHTADGDARMVLNSLEIAAVLRAEVESPETPEGRAEIQLSDIEQAVQRKAPMYDKNGESHYNLISALHKSMRGSDPDAALYWLCRMLSAGEDPLYIARRMVRFATEDIGNADPHALGIAMDAMSAYRFLGSPEGDLALAQAALYLSTAPKSNRVYAGWKNVQAAHQAHGSLPVPMPIRNAPTRLMKEIGYGKGYRYAHDYPEACVAQDYLPEEIQGSRFYQPTDRGYEKTIGHRLDQWRSKCRSAGAGKKKPDR